MAWFRIAGHNMTFLNLKSGYLIPSLQGEKFDTLFIWQSDTIFSWLKKIINSLPPHFSRSIALVEDLDLRDDYDSWDTLQDEMELAYEKSSNNCYIAALLYTVTLVVSGFQFWLNNRAPPTTGYQRYGWIIKTLFEINETFEWLTWEKNPEVMGEKWAAFQFLKKYLQLILLVFYLLEIRSRSFLACPSRSGVPEITGDI